MAAFLKYIIEESYRKRPNKKSEEELPELRTQLPERNKYDRLESERKLVESILYGGKTPNRSLSDDSDNSIGLVS